MRSGFASLEKALNDGAIDRVAGRGSGLTLNVYRRGGDVALFC